MTDPTAELTRLRQLEADARAANLIGPDGKVRRVLGTLPITEDGAIAGPNAMVYWTTMFGRPASGLVERAVTYAGRFWSTPEAAEAARKDNS